MQDLDDTPQLAPLPRRQMIEVFLHALNYRTGPSPDKPAPQEQGRRAGTLYPVLAVMRTDEWGGGGGSLRLWKASSLNLAQNELVGCSQ